VELTKSEMEIMDVLWNSSVPMSRADLLEQSANKCWKDSSIHILLNGLLKKQAIVEAGFVKCSKTYGRTFAPALSREEYYARNIYSYRCKPDIVRLIQALWNRPELTAQQREEIRKLICE